jgi:integrase
MGIYRRGTVWWYRQRIPESLAGRGFESNAVFRVSLRTTDRREALASAAAIDLRLQPLLVRRAMNQDDIDRQWQIEREALMDLAITARDRSASQIPRLRQEAPPEMLEAHLAAHREIVQLIDRIPLMLSPSERKAREEQPEIRGVIAQLAALVTRVEADRDVHREMVRTAVSGIPEAVENVLSQRLGTIPLLSAENVRAAVFEALGDERYRGLSIEARNPWYAFVDQFKKVAGVKEKTFDEYRSAYADLYAITGDIPFVEVTPAHIVEALRRRMARGKPRGKRTVLAPSTQQRFLSGISALLTWAGKNSLADKDRNPASNLKPLDVVKGEDIVSQKRAFTFEELEILYTAPVFTGAKSPRRINTPGRYKCRDDRVWMLLLALLAGWRIGELEVMEVGDVVVENGVMFLSLTERAWDLILDQEIKNESSPRRMVVHPIVRDYGFDEFYRNRRRVAQLKDPLFQLPRPSNTLNRLIDKAGIKDITVSLHSLRHNFVQIVDMSMNGDIEKGLRDSLTGHSTGNARKTYSGSLSPEEAKKFIRLFKVPPAVASLTGWAGPMVEKPIRIRDPD